MTTTAFALAIGGTLAAAQTWPPRPPATSTPATTTTSTTTAPAITTKVQLVEPGIVPAVYVAPGRVDVPGIRTERYPATTTQADAWVDCAHKGGTLSALDAGWACEAFVVVADG